MKERYQPSDMKIVVNGKGNEEKVPYPIGNPPIGGEKATRPTLTDYEQGLEWNRQAREHAERALSFTQEYAKRIVEPKYTNRIMMVLLSDIHWGHFDTDPDLVDSLFRYVEETPDTYTFMGWNLLDGAIPAQYPDGVMWSGMTAQEQVYTFRDKLLQLHAQNKILGAIGDSACHEGWMKRKTGWMIYRELFEGMDDIPLLLNGGYLDIQVGKELYRTAHFHKSKYASTLNKAHGGERAMDRLADAEIVTMGHYHFAVAQQSQRYNPPFTEETAILASGSCKISDKWARGRFGSGGEKPGQAIMLWGDRHAKQVIFDLENGCEMMRDASLAPKTP